MADPIRQESPLVLRQRTGQPPQAAMQPGASLTERPLRGLVNVRGAFEDTAFAAAIDAAVGLPLPSANRYAVNDDRYLIWLGPNELLVSVPPGEQGAIEANVARGLAGQFHAVTDVSSGYTTLRIAGPRARELIASGCPLDLHPRALPRGACAGTHIAKAQTVLLHGAADGEFQVIVRRSFADYLWQWLADAGAGGK